MSFTRTKDRIWAGYDVFAAWLARRPGPVRRIGYGVFGVVLWIAYVLPGNSVRPTFVALATVSATMYAIFAGSASQIFSSPTMQKRFSYCGGSLLSGTGLWVLLSRKPMSV